MKSTRWFLILLTLLPVLAAPQAEAQTVSASDLIMAVDNLNGTSTLYTYLGSGQLPGTWTASPFGATIPTTAIRICQDSGGQGTVFVLAQGPAGTSTIYRLLTPQIGGYGSIFFPSLPPVTIYSTTATTLWDIWVDRSSAGNPGGGKSLVALGVNGSSQLTLTRIPLAGGPPTPVTPIMTTTPVNLYAAMAIDPTSGNIHIGTDLAWMCTVTPQFVATSSVPLSPVMVVNAMSWNNTGLGSQETLVLGGYDVVALQTPVVRRYAPTGVSNSAPMYASSDAVVDVATDSSGHIYSLRATPTGAVVDHFNTGSHAGTLLPALPGSLTTTRAISWFSRNARGRFGLLPPANLFMAITAPMTIGPTSLRIQLSAFAGGQPLPPTGTPVILHCSPTHLWNNPLTIPGVGNLLVNIADPAYFTVNATVSGTATVTVPFTMTPNLNGLALFIQTQVVSGSTTYLTDSAGTVTVGYMPVE